ncbi:hypothetical protein ACTFIU_010026 [Dictyostelium citrinum]
MDPMMNNLNDYSSLDPFDVKLVEDKHHFPSTSGGELTLTASGGYNKALAWFEGDLSSDSYDFRKPNVNVHIPPGYGQYYMQLGYKKITNIDFQYAPPTISNVSYDDSKSELFINGDSFYYQFLDGNKNKITIQKVVIDGIAIEERDIQVTIEHTQIKIKNFTRVIPGPISIFLSIDDTTIEKNYTHCFTPIITSITSVSNTLGGIITIKGSFLSYNTTPTNSNSFSTTIKIGDKICKFINSTTKEIVCQLDSNNGGSNLPISILFNMSKCPESVNDKFRYTYSVPTLINGTSDNGLVTLYGINIGREIDSIIQISGEDINQPINLSND